MLARVGLHSDIGIGEPEDDGSIPFALGEGGIVLVATPEPRGTAGRVDQPRFRLSRGGLLLRSLGLRFGSLLGGAFADGLDRLSALGSPQTALVLPSADAGLVRVLGSPSAVAALPPSRLAGALTAGDAELAHRPRPFARAMALTTSFSISSRNQRSDSFLAVATNRRRGSSFLPRVKA